MNLFSQLLEPPINLLPQDGEANYHGVVFSAEDADYFLDYLTNHIAWKNDAAIIFNKKITILNIKSNGISCISLKF